MKVRKLGLLAAVGVVAALPVVSADADAPRDKATGGGQLLLDPNNPPTTGALDTLAFTAQREQGASDDSGLADGQVQVNRRSGDQTQVKFHGIVECLVVLGDDTKGEAYISGHQRGTTTPFELYVVDGGSGAAERGGDQGLLWYGSETTSNDPDNQTPPFSNGLGPEPSHCGIEEDPSSKRAIPPLARGNYQVRNYTAPSQQSAAAAKQSKSSTSLTSLSL